MLPEATRTVTDATGSWRCVLDCRCMLLMQRMLQVMPNPGALGFSRQGSSSSSSMR